MNTHWIVLTEKLNVHGALDDEILALITEEHIEDEIKETGNFRESYILKFTRQPGGQSDMVLSFTDLMNVTEEVTIQRPNVSTLLSSAFIRGDLNAATRGPFI